MSLFFFFSVYGDLTERCRCFQNPKIFRSILRLNLQSWANAISVFIYWMILFHCFKGNPWGTIKYLKRISTSITVMPSHVMHLFCFDLALFLIWNALLSHKPPLEKWTSDSYDSTRKLIRYYNFISGYCYSCSIYFETFNPFG